MLIRRERREGFRFIDTFVACLQSLYLATVFAGAMVCLLTSLMLFARRKSGERSRIILSCIVLFSVFNYITRFVALLKIAYAKHKPNLGIQDVAVHTCRALRDEVGAGIKSQA